MTVFDDIHFQLSPPHEVDVMERMRRDALGRLHAAVVFYVFGPNDLVERAYAAACADGEPEEAPTPAFVLDGLQASAGLAREGWHAVEAGPGVPVEDRALATGAATVALHRLTADLAQWVHMLGEHGDRFDSELLQEGITAGRGQVNTTQALWSVAEALVDCWWLQLVRSEPMDTESEVRVQWLIGRLGDLFVLAAVERFYPSPWSAQRLSQLTGAAGDWLDLLQHERRSVWVDAASRPSGPDRASAPARDGDQHAPV